MKTKKENPVLLLLKWAEKDRGLTRDLVLLF